jgi:hypothetical protein
MERIFKKFSLLALLILIVSMIWVVISTFDHNTQEEIKTTVVDKNGNQVKPYTPGTGELGK